MSEEKPLTKKENDVDVVKRLCKQLEQAELATQKALDDQRVGYQQALNQAQDAIKSLNHEAVNASKACVTLREQLEESKKELAQEKSYREYLERNHADSVKELTLRSRINYLLPVAVGLLGNAAIAYAVYEGIKLCLGK